MNASRICVVLTLCCSPLGLLACGGGSTSGGDLAVAPASLTYSVAAGQYRVSEAIPPNVASVTGGSVATFSITPDLPAGLALDASSGQISGTPTAETVVANHTVTAANPAGSTTADVSIGIGPALPAAFASLAAGFKAESVATGLVKVAKMVLLPDGRILYTEVDTGNVRVIDANGTLLPTPYLSLSVTNNGHQGLLGLAVSPTFMADGFVYVQATLLGPDAATPIQTMVLRFTDDAVNNVGTAQAMVAQLLPASNINNGGELVFDNSGALLVSIGDAEVPANAQAAFATSAAGKILRFDVSSAPGQVPADNPDPTSPEFCRGLRNTFGLAVHPVTNTILGVENGPTANDELNLIEPGKNFEWGAANAIPSPGRQLTTYAEVIVPTAVTWHDGTTWGAAYANNVFMTSYADQRVRRFVMTGATFTNIDSESVFCELALQADNNKPLDITVGTDGALYITTFTGIWKITPM